jgi:Holliday junction resolvase
MRLAAKIDANQQEIVRKLRAVGCTVETLAAVGKGVPDLLVGFKGKNYLFEVKDGLKPPSQRKLTPDQVVWHEKWRGNIKVIVSFQQALDYINEKVF